MTNYYCEHCGQKYSSVSSLTASLCFRHPLGANKGKHKLFEGREAASYTCKFCGTHGSTLTSLTAGLCHRHPQGPNKGKHAPALT